MFSIQNKLLEKSYVSVEILASSQEHTTTTTASPFPEKVNSRMNEFENSEFYQKVQFGTQESLEEALDLIAQNKVDVHLISTNEERKGWTYLHFVIDR